eukprot:scaffold577922_cov38-Prasinocladus_malaysianus.AAC.1
MVPRIELLRLSVAPPRSKVDLRRAIKQKTTHKPSIRLWRDFVENSPFPIAVAAPCAVSRQGMPAVGRAPSAPPAPAGRCPSLCPCQSGCERQPTPSPISPRRGR